MCGAGVHPVRYGTATVATNAAATANTPEGGGRFAIRLVDRAPGDTSALRSVGKGGSNRYLSVNYWKISALPAHPDWSPGAGVPSWNTRIPKPSAPLP